MRRFSDNSAVLQQAMESAVARKAYKGDRIRATAVADRSDQRRRAPLIELQVAHARQQMRSKRPDLATRGLTAAYEWGGRMRRARWCPVHGLVGLQAGEKGRRRDPAPRAWHLPATCRAGSVRRWKPS